MDSIIETSNGRLRGVVRNGVHTFLGVHYGADTSAGNRFRAPQPVEKWAGIKNADRHGASAPQLPVAENTEPFYAWYSAIEPISQDCLVLNLFTAGTSGARPIMVWLHGGGWSSYSGTAPGFDGSSLAREQDVVVICINHRLGVFGHLYLGGRNEQAADASNAGILDVVAALEWIKANASAFGGDPGCVTMFGESGGGSKIAALMAMPRAKGLFHRAVIQSTGSARRLATIDEADRMAHDLSAQLGLSTLDLGTLQALPVSSLLEACRSSGGLFRGTVDYRHFHQHPFDDTAPALASAIPLMIGCTATECSYYMRWDERNFALDLSEATARLARFVGISIDRSKTIIDTYRGLHPEASPSQLLNVSCSDYMFKRCTYGIAELQAAKATVPVYAYHFEWRTPIEGGRMGSPHTSEVPLVFGTSSEAAACLGQGRGPRSMSSLMMSTWASFARNGDPTNPSITKWLPFNQTQRQMMCLDRESHMAFDPSWPGRIMFDGAPEYQYGQSMQPMISPLST